MTKEEYDKKIEEDFDSLDRENAIRILKLFNKSSQLYFHNWMEAEKEIEKLKLELLKK